jgi:hypothetical protein
MKLLRKLDAAKSATVGTQIDSDKAGDRKRDEGRENGQLDGLGFL